MRRLCFFHAGCPDGFGAAWAAWRAWGDDGHYLARGHADPLEPERYAGDLVVFADIAPSNPMLLGLARVAARLVVLDHHVTARDRYLSEPDAARAVAAGGHLVRFDLEHSGAWLAWQHFHPGEPAPDLVRYVEDQDLWNWKLPFSEEVNAAIGSYPRDLRAWDELAARPIPDLAEEGAAIVRADRAEVERALSLAHPIAIDGRAVDAVNARYLRAPIGHGLALRAAHGEPWGAVYRVQGNRVDVSLYSIGDLDVAKVAEAHGGGGHRNAAGFSVPLATWLEQFVGQP
jgi:hypothetical protein